MINSEVINTDTVLAALISAVSAILICLINSSGQHKKLILELDRHNEMQAYRIEQLEKKVDKHNGVVERTYRMEEQIKVANHRIADLENKK